MLRLLADENVPLSAVFALRKTGHDVTWVNDVSPGLRDADVLAWAASEQRVLLTFDKDFGELARQAGLCGQAGVILVRLPYPPAAEAGQRVAQLISERDDWAGHFSVVEPGRIRMRRLSGGPGSPRLNV